MAIIAIDGYDIWSYTRVAPGEGLDLSDTDFLDPQFGDSGTSFGDPLINVDIGNREIAIPVHLKSPDKTKTALHTLVTGLNRRLSVAKVLEIRDDGASVSSYLDIEFARFEPEFNKRRQDAGWMSGVVRLFTRPYARLVSSGYATVAGSGAATGVIGSLAMPASYIGDGPVTLRWQLTAPSAVGQTDGRIIGAAIVPSGYIVDWPAASIVPLNSASLMGASGAAGSQVIGHTALDIFTGVNLQPFAQVVLTNASVYAGNNRVFAVANSRLPKYALGLVSADSSPVSRAIPSSLPGQGFSTLDLGVVYVDPLASATTVLRIAPYTDAPANAADWYLGLSLASAGQIGTDFQLNRILIVPEDTTSLLVDDSRRRALSSFDTYRPGGTYTYPYSIDDNGNSASPAIFSGVASYGLRVNINHAAASTLTTAGAGGIILNATSADLSGSADGRMELSASNIIIAVGKYCFDGFNARMYSARVLINGNASQSIANGAINIVTNGGGLGLNTASVLASVAFNAGTVLGGVNLPIRLMYQQQGGVIKAKVFIHTGSLGIITATCTASIGGAALPGQPYIGVMGHGNTGITKFDFTQVPSTGIRGGDNYVNDTDKQIAYRGVDSNFSLGFAQRGAHLQSAPNATAVGAFVPFVLPLDGGPTNQNWSFSLSYNEHFTYYA